MYYGPYEVIERIGSVAYKLRLPDVNLIHPVFHVSHLKSFTPDHSPIHHVLSVVPVLDVKAVAPKIILDRRLVKKGNMAITQVLTKWSGLPESSATWEDYSVVRCKFPSSTVWGQSYLRWGRCHHTTSGANDWSELKGWNGLLGRKSSC
jgi:hypothetical protein